MRLPHFRCLSAPCFSLSRSTFSFPAFLYCYAKPVLRDVVFDMDGTLTVPANDFSAMYRAALGDEGYTAAKSGSPGGSVDILHHIESWAPQEQHRAYEIIAAGS